MTGNPENFGTDAAEPREREFARLAAAVVPTLESLRSLTPKPFRAEVATMLERLGYQLATSESVANLVGTKDGRKYIVACAPPADFAPTSGLARVVRTGTPERRVLHASPTRLIGTPDGGR